ncbi:hypothetical protein BKA65DRAFT_501860 [Rhexocercosporidium sp. MPI-PUGE-AT-0058]|nr:hypothetical protein BKA65DRAFT_501860 [Rhexocercosporidium sp. MPI-PUGE-AT-0058]
MKSFAIYLPALFATGTFAAQFFKLGAASSLQKRLTCGTGNTCQEACGGGAIQCGTSGSHCYDPTLGETCCLADEHYCLKDQFCAPVVGYCCDNGEDAATCAVRQGFTLTPSAPTSTPAAAASTAVTILSSGAMAPTITSTGPAITFTGAAVKKDSAAGAILMGAIGLMAAL